MSEPAPEPDLSINYFNYFTEVEEHFQRARGTSIFLLSPLDWALIETWKNAGIPLEAVLRGIDLAFEKWRAKPKKTQLVNSVAFCAQAVLTEAQRMSGTDQPRPEKSEASPFANSRPTSSATLTLFAKPASLKSPPPSTNCSPAPSMTSKTSNSASVSSSKRSSPASAPGSPKTTRWPPARLSTASSALIAAR